MAVLAMILENGQNIFVESRYMCRRGTLPEPGAETHDQTDNSSDRRKLPHIAILIRPIAL